MAKIVIALAVFICSVLTAQEIPNIPGTIGHWCYPAAGNAAIQKGESISSITNVNAKYSGGGVFRMDAFTNALSGPTSPAFNMDFGTPRTICLWVKITNSSATGGACDLMGKDKITTTRGWVFTIQNLADTNFGKLQFAIFDATGTNFIRRRTSTSVLISNVWTHYAASFIPSNNVRLWVNGIEKSVSTNDTSFVMGAPNTNSTSLQIGAREISFGSDFSLLGQISDVWYVRSALSTAEINAMKNWSKGSLP